MTRQHCEGAAHVRLWRAAAGIDPRLAVALRGAYRAGAMRAVWEVAAASLPAETVAELRGAWRDILRAQHERDKARMDARIAAARAAWPGRG